MKTKLGLFLLFLSTLAATTVAASSCPMHPGAPPELSANHECCRIAQEEWAATVTQLNATGESLFQIESRWTNQNGKAASFAQVSGKPQLLALAYTNCQYACPRILADLKSIENQMPKSANDQYGIVIVSIDPERDTPARFLEYSSTNELNLNRWTFLNGDASDVLEIANLLGVRYQRLPNGEYSHSNIITLLNAQGEIVLQQKGLGSDSTPTVEKLKELLK